MRKSLQAMLVVVFVCLAPFAQAWSHTEGGRGISPLADEPEWSDDLGDMSNVYVPPGGLVGVEVTGGEVRLLPGHDKGWVASTIINCPEGFRYDLVVLEASLPGESYVNVSLLDATKAPTEGGWANATIPGFVNLTGTHVSVFRVPYRTYTQVRIQVNLVASGTDRPRLLSWGLRFISLDEWRDDMSGPGKMSTIDGIVLSGGTATLDLSGTGGGAYDAYPTVLFPSTAGGVDVFYATSGNDGYQNVGEITGTSTTRGLHVDDLDGDGYLDLILAMGNNVNDPDSMILWGSSSGTWSTSDKTTLGTGDFGVDAATGDFDGDGDLDVAIACVGNMAGGSSYAWYNQGDGSFNRPPDVTFQGLQACTVDCGDVNNDGYDDIIFVRTNYIDGPCFYGSQTGVDAIADLNFLQENDWKFAQRVIIEDVDGDGYDDVLFAMRNNNNAGPIYKGGSSGVDITADIELPLQSPAMDMAIGDVNGDGYTDIIYSTWNSGANTFALECFEGSSGGWDSGDKHTLAAGNGLNPVLVVDVDKDGYGDILTGEAGNFKIYKGGASWPTAVSITKAGLNDPEDMAVAIPPDGGGGGIYSGYWVTEAIPRPTDLRWDIMYVDADVPEGTTLSVTLLDASKQVIPGYEDLPGPDVDLSGIENWATLHVRVELVSPSNATTPVVRQLLVNWVDRNVWRDQFYGWAKVESALNMGVLGLELVTTGTVTGKPELVFAILRNDDGYGTPSVAFRDAGGLDYTHFAPILLETVGASAVAAYDVNGDGIDDLAFASYGKAEGSYAGDSPLFLGSPAGYYGAPHHTFSTTGARDVALADLNGDGHADVVFAQERDFSGPGVKSALYWGSASGWNSTPDVEFATTGASAVEVADLDSDGRLDLVFACYEGTSVNTDSMVFYQGTSGFSGTSPDHRLDTVGARDVAWGDLDDDGHLDLVFANSFDGASYETESYVYWGQAGRGFMATPTELYTTGATDVDVVDLDGDGDLDVIAACSRNESGGYLAIAGILINDGTGRLTYTSMHSIVTNGAFAVAPVDLDGAGVIDLAFACRNNGSGYSVPSVVYQSPWGSWPFDPNILLPTVGAVDVTPAHLSDPDRGGYLSQAITPDPGDDVGTFHTLRYEASLVAGQSGIIAILDAITGEKLAETAMASGPQEWDLRGLFPYDEHPSIRIMVAATGLEGQPDLSLDDLWINWTGRVPLAPRVLDLSLTDPTVLRGDAVELWVTVEDERDAPDALTITVEHQLEGQTDWGTGILGGSALEGNVWKVTIAPDVMAPLGNYSFRVNVTDTDGLFSGFVLLEGTLEVLPNLLGPPMILKLSPADGQIRVEWRAPIHQGDMAPEGYRVHRGTAEGELEVVATVDALTTSHLDDDLTNGVVYFYAVSAFNELGPSPLSEVLNATPLSLPGPPRDLAIDAGDGTASLTWQPPLKDGGHSVLGYLVFRRMGTSDPEEVGNVTGTNFEDSGLENGVTYWYTVSAYTELGEGLTCDPVEVVPHTLPGAPAAFEVAAGRLNLTLSWDPPSVLGGGTLASYRVYHGLDADSLGLLVELDAVITTFTVEGLEAGTEYFYAVAAVTEFGEGARSPVLSAVPIDVPGSPLGLAAVPGDGTVTLTWSPPEDDGVSAILGYVVLRGRAVAGMEPIAWLGVELTYVDSTAVNGQTYYYAVAAINDAGQGEASDHVQATPLVPDTVPGQVMSLAVTAKDGRTVLVWLPPVDDGGSPVTGYVLYRGTSQTDLEKLTEVGLLTTYTDKDVKGGKVYYYTVAAVNAVGEGETYTVQQVKVPETEDEGGGLVWLAIALVVIVLVLLALLYITRKRPATTTEGEGPVEQT